MSELIVRCSSIGRLMADPVAADLDPDYVDDEVRRILDKTKRTDEEKSILAEVRRKSLSAGGKSHVRELVREAVYGYEPAELNTRPILKGRAVEQACIEMLSRLLGRPLVKNTERRTNGLISGEPDVIDLSSGRDIKAPYSMAHMPVVLADCYDSDYEHQMRGYMMLWRLPVWHVDYLLVNTPDDLIGFEPAALHYVDHIEERLRWTSWTVERDPKLEDLIADKVLAARKYYRQVLNEFDRTHREVQPEPTGLVAPWRTVSPDAQDSQRQESGALTDPNTTGNGNMAHPTADAAPGGGSAEGEGATAPSPGTAAAEELVAGTEPPPPQGADPVIIDLTPTARAVDHDAAARAFVALVLEAFEGRFPTHPKPPQEWWARVRQHGDELRELLGAS